MTEHVPIRAESIPRFIDFEASSLASGSHPIEVAWSSPNGLIESHFISPAGVERWTDWSVKAEQLHGIRRTQLLIEGKSPNWICRRLNEALDGAMVYTDDPDYDGQWLAELFSATWGMVPTFTLASADQLLIGMLAKAFSDRADALRILAQTKIMVRSRLNHRHRAAWDVEYLLEVWHTLNGEIFLRVE